MKNFYLLIVLSFFYIASAAQTVQVSGMCITDTVSLEQVPDLINGKVAYTGTGTVDGNAGVTISIYWIGSPDNLWVLDFDGQPYFQSTCAFDLPPSSYNASCPWTAVTETTCSGADPLFVIGSGVLAVKLLRFSASELNGQVLLSWQTANEPGKKTFDIQRSNDGRNWHIIGTLAGNDDLNTQYQFADKQPISGKNYYRLLQKDNNGRSTYSSIVTANVNSNKLFTVSAISNGHYLLTMNAVQTAGIMVTDLSGRRLLTTRAAAGTCIINLKGNPSGVYLLRVSANGQVLTQKLVNQ